MGFEECYQLGNVIKTHGLKGEVAILIDADIPENYKNLESVFIEINGKLVPFFIESLNLQGDKAIVKFEEIENIDDAMPLVSSNLFLPLKSLPKLAKGKYYFHELPGLSVFEGETLIGTVTGVVDMPNGDLLTVDHDGTEMLIPLMDEIVTLVDVSAKRVEVTLPPGLLELYLEGK
jgi:16S rRNA processing protein RimM